LSLDQQLLLGGLIFVATSSLIYFIVHLTYYPRSLAHPFYKKRKKLKPFEALFRGFYFIFLPLVSIALMICFDIVPLN